MGRRCSKAVTRAAAAAGIAALAATFPAAAQIAVTTESLTGVSGGDDLADLASRGDRDPGKARRIVRIFDFEEPDNPDPVPRDWFRAQETPTRPRPGFPLYNEARFDRTGGRGGGSAVMIPIKGGSNSLRLMPGVIPVLPFGDYAVTAWVRTDRLVHARAFLTIRLLDERGEPLPGAEVRTEPLRTNTTADEPGPWRPVSLRIAGRHADAAYLQVDCEVLQPQHFSPKGFLGDARIRLEDVDARVWFDDLTIYQLPRIELIAEKGMAEGAQAPELRIIVRDLVGDALRARVTVRDIDGRTVATGESPVRADGEPWRWRPSLERYGWYTADLEVSASGIGGATGSTTIGATRLQFAWLAPSSNPGAAPAAMADRRRFGLIADRIDEFHLPRLPDLLDAAGARFVHVWAWRVDDDPARLEQAAPVRRATIDELTARGHDVTMVLTSVPAALAERSRTDPNDPLQLAHMEATDWTPWLNPLLEQYGQRIRRWSVMAARRGWDGAGSGELVSRSLGADGALWRRDVSAELLVFDGLIRRLAPGPIVGLSWRADWGLPRNLLAARTDPVPAFVPSQPPTPGSPVLDAVTLTYPAWLPPSSMELLAEEIRGVAAEAAQPSEAPVAPPEITMVLDLPTGASPRGRVIETMRRTVEFWRAFGDDGVSRLALDHPWALARDLDEGGREAELQAGAELVAFRTLIDRLAGRRILGSLDLTPGVRCYFLARRDPVTGALDDGALVAWNESSEGEHATLRFLTGDKPLTIVDAFGNQAKLAVPASERTQLISVGDAPVFIEGIDPYIASFISTFRIDQPFVEAVSAVHEREFIVHNPWPTALEVIYQIRPPRHGDPGEWIVSPRGTERFFLPAGATERVPISFRFGPAEMAGHQKMEVVFRLRADKEYPALVLTAPLEIGLSDLELTPDFILMPTASGPDVSIVAMLTNTGSRTRTLRMEVRAPGLPSQAVHISNLEPGGSTRRQFYFPGAAAALSGKSVTIKVEDNDSPIYLRKAVVIP